MSLIDNFLHERRKRKLEEVNKELERLKQQHPFDPASLKPKAQYANTYHEYSQHTMRPRSFLSLWTGIAILLVVILIAFIFYYKDQVAALEESRQQEEMKSKNLQTMVDNLTAKLDETSQELKKKIANEYDLSDQSDQLREEKELLEEEKNNFEKDILIKEAQITTINQTLTQKYTEITRWKACIRKVFNEDPDDCNIT